jgi:hypothetical protein
VVAVLDVDGAGLLLAELVADHPMDDDIAVLVMRLLSPGPARR